MKSQVQSSESNSAAQRAEQEQTANDITLTELLMQTETYSPIVILKLILNEFP